MGKKEDELEIAKFAAMTAGALKQVDSSKINHGTGGPATKIDPRSFISQPAKRQAPPQKQIKIPGMVEAPVSRPMGAVPVDPAMIPATAPQMVIPEGIDKETEAAIKRHMAEDNSPPMIPGGRHVIPTPAPSALPNRDVKTTEIKPGNDDLTKAINYLKRKMRAIEKNQAKIIEMLGKLLNEK